MNETLVAQGYSASDLAGSEQLIPPGSNVEIRLFFEYDLSPDEVMDFELGLFDQGVELTGPVTYASRVMIIPFFKPDPAGIGLAFLPILGISALVGGGSIFGWQMFSDGVDDTMDKMFKIVIVGGAVIIGLIAVKVIM